MDQSIKNNLLHDAVGLTHLPDYFYDVSNGKILFVNALKNKAYIYNLTNSQPIDSLGDGNALNKQITQLPFSTKIIPYTNPKSIIKQVNSFVQEMDRYEGGRFVNDSTILLVKKNKGKSIKGKRIIFFYQLNSKTGSWEFKFKRTFKNNLNSKRYGIFQFYYPTTLKIQNNRVYISEAYCPNTKVSKIKLVRALMKEENLKIGIYEYYLQP